MSSFPTYRGTGARGAARGAAPRQLRRTQFSRWPRPRRSNGPRGSVTRSAASSRCAQQCGGPRRCAASFSPPPRGLARRRAWTRDRHPDGARRAGKTHRSAPARVGGSPLGRRVAFGWWGVGDAVALDPRLAEALFLGPAPTRIRGRAGARCSAPIRSTSSTGSRARCCASGERATVGQARRRYRICAPPRRAAANDRGLRPPPDRERPEVCRAAIEELSPRSLSRPPAPRTGSLRRRRPRHWSAARRGTRPAARRPRSLCAACPPPPTSATSASRRRQRAGPCRGTRRRARPGDPRRRRSTKSAPPSLLARSTAKRKLATCFVRSDLAQLDVGREVSDQRDDVHGGKRRAQPVKAGSKVRAGRVPPRWACSMD